MPVRIPKPSEKLIPPLIDVYVKNGVKQNKINKIEAEALINEIERLVNDPNYEDRTIGVVSLTGFDQANYIQKQLLTRIGEQKFLKHNIACGDSSTFQGKERDIMFISMIASPGNSRALTTRVFRQRFNVALSRAKDRMYLFRSVDFDDLRGNDLRYKVLQHFNDPMPNDKREIRELIELCQSNFEKDFFNKMVSKGYKIIPQVGIGGYFIDFIIEGDNDNRLAIELDGDFHMEQWQEDMKRQRLLERTGLVFWRCWHSSYILDPEKCIQHLIQTLEDMEIKPIGFDGTVNQYTENRVLEENFIETDAVDFEEIKSDDILNVENGDKVTLSFQNGTNKSYQSTIQITNNKHDPKNGYYRIDSNETKPLLGLTIDDEVEFIFQGKKQKAVIENIKKAS